MNFKTIINIINKTYKFLEKFNLESIFDIDLFLDNNYPKFTSILQQYANNKKTIFCSTNGKKTSSNLFNQILKANNSEVISNLTRKGSFNSIFTSIILHVAKETEYEDLTKEDNFMNIVSDYMELNKNFRLMNFDYLVLNNIFTSQIDFSSIYEIKRKIQNAILLNSKLNLIINADEPMFFDIDNIKNDTAIEKKRNKFYYSINEIETFDNSEKIIHPTDIIKCPMCGCDLQYKKRFYSHIGHYYCECGFRRPEPNMYANVKVFADYSFMEVFYNDKKMVFKVPLGGISNAYNALSVIALATVLKINRKTISDAFENYKPIKGRDEAILCNNKKIKIKVMKNSTSLSEAVYELYGAKNKKVVFVFDSNYIDGTDTSWIWEANLSCFESFDNRIYITGKRYDDMALRLKYAGANPALITIDSKIKNSINCCYWALENNEEMLIITVPSLLNEVKKYIEFKF